MDINEIEFILRNGTTSTIQFEDIKRLSEKIYARAQEEKQKSFRRGYEQGKLETHMDYIYR